MTDRPTLDALIDAVRHHVESTLVPVARADPKLYFQTLVALNLLRIAVREINAAPAIADIQHEVLVALSGEVDGTSEVPTVALCQAIRRGEFDSPERFDSALRGLSRWVHAQLTVNNPALANRMQDESNTGQFAL